MGVCQCKYCYEMDMRSPNPHYDPHYALRRMEHNIMRSMELQIEQSVQRQVSMMELTYITNGIVGTPITETAIKHLTQGDKKMNIVTYAKLNKNQRTLYKVGIVDIDGHLTSEGRNVLLDMLASDAATQTKLVDIAKEYKKDQKED